MCDCVGALAHALAERFQAQVTSLIGSLFDLFSVRSAFLPSPRSSVSPLTFSPSSSLLCSLCYEHTYLKRGFLSLVSPILMSSRSSALEIAMILPWVPSVLPFNFVKS